MAKQRNPRRLEVLDVRQLTPSMRRLTIGGAELAGFPADHDGGYIKLFLPDDAKAGDTSLRTYTIRTQYEDRLDVDFALHGDHAAGLATGWAMTTRPGDWITIGGPGAPKPFPAGDVFHLIAGDMSALPAIGANLKRAAATMPDARGHAVIEVQDEADRQELEAPSGISIEWLVNPEPGMHPDLLADALRRALRPEDGLAGWGAAEFGAMKKLRGLFCEELSLRPPHLYISSYWKLGLNEIEHKVVKREDAQTQPA